MAKSENRRMFLRQAILGVGCVASCGPLDAEILRRRSMLRCALPQHDYEHNTPKAQALLLTNAARVDQVYMSFQSLRMQHTRADELLPGENTAKTALDSVTRLEQLPHTRLIDNKRKAILPSIHNTEEAASQPQLVRRKTFTPQALSLISGEVILDRTAFALYETGHVACSGRIAHRGGQFQELLGGKVTLRVQAFGRPDDANYDPPNGPILAGWEQSFWVSFQSSPLDIPLIRTQFDPRIRMNFDQITHMLVNVLYWRSR